MVAREVMVGEVAEARIEQPNTLVVAERIDAQARLLRNLLAGECCFQRQDYETWSALQIKRPRESNGVLL